MHQKYGQSPGGCPWSDYGLSLIHYTGVRRYVIYAAQIFVSIVLSYLSLILYGPLSYNGIPLFYLAAPFYVAFIMWWGAWGMIGVYVGSFFGSGLLFGLGILPSLVYSATYLIASMIPFLVYRGLLRKRGIDPFFRDLIYSNIGACKTKRKEAWLWFISIVVILVNLVGAIIGVGIEYGMGFVPSQVYWLWWFGWVVSGLVPMLLVTPVVMIGFTRVLEDTNMLNRGWFG
ncbi:MAG: MASE1 domain-containing protein [Nitrososphaeria archaeon]